MNLLFICGRNQWRSPTAAKIFGRRAGLSVRSAGLSAKSPHTVNEGDLAWADVVFVMESEHRVRLRERFGRLSVEVCVLEIPDDYQFLSDAGGVGLNLQRAASCCINLELPWNPAVLEQRIGRIYRLGQKLPIDVYNLVSEDGIESRIAKLLAQKRALFTSLFDGTSDEVVFDEKASFMDGVKRLVEPPELAAPLALLLESLANPCERPRRRRELRRRAQSDWLDCRESDDTSTRC